MAIEAHTAYSTVEASAEHRLTLTTVETLPSTEMSATSKASLLAQQINDISQKYTTLKPTKSKYIYELPVTVQNLFHQASTLDLLKTKRKTSKTLHSYSKTGKNKLGIAFSIQRMGF